MTITEEHAPPDSDGRQWPARLGELSDEQHLSLSELIDRIDPIDGLHEGEQRQIPCQSHDPEVWFAETPADVEFAKALCATCPVRDTCLAGARERCEPWGVWGGQLFAQGVPVARKRPRGRPRKNPVAA